MRKILAWVLGAALAANGLFMLGDPAGWYAAIPGVTMTGPLNPHLVRDVGCAYLMAGAALAAFVVDARARPAALAGAAFLALHAFVHLWDLASGRESLPPLPRRSAHRVFAACARLVARMAHRQSREGETSC